MILKEYPNYDVKRDAQELLTQICNIRKDDIVQAKNLDFTFVSGRKVGRIPSASNDVISGDKIGDLNYDSDYIYILVDNAGTGVWRRAALGSW